MTPTERRKARPSTGTIRAGKSADEAAASLGLPGKYRAYDMANAKADVQRVYEELASAR
jgi:hypothetical protein